VQDSVGGKDAYQFLQNFVGSAVIIEGSLEMRYRFTYPSVGTNFGQSNGQTWALYSFSMWAMLSVGMSRMTKPQ